MRSSYDVKAAKKPTNVSVNSDLLKKARELNVNLSSLLERALEAYLKDRLREQWLEENREAIEKYNEDVESNGVFGDGVRGF